MELPWLHSCYCSSQQTDKDVHAGDLKYAAMLDKGERDFSVKHDFPPTKMTSLGPSCEAGDGLISFGSFWFLVSLRDGC